MGDTRIIVLVSWTLFRRQWYLWWRRGGTKYEFELNYTKRERDTPKEIIEGRKMCKWSWSIGLSQISEIYAGDSELSWG